MRTRCLPRSLRILARLVFCAPLAACAGAGDRDAEMRERMTDLFITIYDEVAEVHIDPLDAEAFTVAGLRGLSMVQPGLNIELDDGSVDLSVGDATVVSDETPDVDASPRSWALFARDVVWGARDGADLLSTASEEDLNTGFFDGAMRSLDRFSRYADPESAEDLRAEREGAGGIGVELESHPEGARVAGVDLDRPAAAAGLLVGDRIVAVDGEAVAGASLRRIEKLLRGRIDEPVALIISREGLVEPLEVQVGRIRIVPETVFPTRIGDHALIRISSFNRRTSKRLAEAVAQARDEIGDAMSGIILDLRGNPGGLVDQAVESADLFLDAGMISSAKGRHVASGQRFEAETGDIAAGIPIIVLINGASASAAEILSAALQDNGRAVLIGMNTFGKGTIQTVIEDLPNGGELYVTWARFIAPSGYALQRVGVMPTICTSGAEDAVVALEDGLSVETENGARALLGARRTIDPEDEEAVRALLKRCPWRPHASGDIDLTIAELLLESPTLMRRALEVSRPGHGA